MAIIATSSGSDGEKVKELCPAGSYSAVCFSIIDIGFQTIEFYDKELKEKVNKHLHKILMAWEIDERMTQEGALKNKRFVVSRKFTVSLHEKSALRPFLESWRGKGFTEEEEKAFDVEQLIGNPCLISIVHNTALNGKVYDNVGSASPLMKNMTPISVETDWSEKRPEWIQNLADTGWTIQESDSDSCKLAKAKLLVAKEEADKTEKPVIATTATTSEAEDIGAESTAELIAECDKEKAMAQAEADIPFGSPSEDVSSLSEPEVILKIRKMCMELKIEVQKHITAVLGSPITTDKLTKEQAENVLLELIKIKQSAESFTEDDVPF